MIGKTREFVRGALRVAFSTWGQVVQDEEEEAVEVVAMQDGEEVEAEVGFVTSFNAQEHADLVTDASFSTWDRLPKDRAAVAADLRGAVLDPDNSALV